MGLQLQGLGLSLPELHPQAGVGGRLLQPFMPAHELFALGMPGLLAPLRRLRQARLLSQPCSAGLRMGLLPGLGLQGLPLRLPVRPL